MSSIFAFLVTLSMALTAGAQEPKTSCISTLNQKVTRFQFKGGDYNLWNWVGSPYTATLEFDATKRGGEIKYSTNWGPDNTLTIVPETKEMRREAVSGRHDQEIGEQNVILLDCSNSRYKKSCQNSAKKIFDELVLIRSRSVETLTESERKTQDDAIECVFEALQRTVF